MNLRLPFIAFSLIGLAVPGYGQNSFDPSAVAIGELSYAGNGCPAESVAWTLSDDRQAMTMIFDQFAVETTGALPTNEGRSRKSCRVQLRLQAPANWQFSIFYMDFRGFAALDPGTTGIHQSTYRLGSGPIVNLGRFTLAGPLSDDYQRVEDLSLNTAVWSTCTERQQRVEINSTVAVHGRAGSGGYMTLDSMDGVIAHSYGLAWRRCAGNPQPAERKWTAHCKANIIRSSDKSLVRQVVMSATGPNEGRALRAAQQAVTAKCQRTSERNSRRGPRQCSPQPLDCRTSQL